MTSYLWWTPLILAFFALYAYFTKQNNLYGGAWFWVLIVAGAFPGWAIISRVSKNVMLDSLVYDGLSVLGYYGFLVALGFTKGFTLVQYFGLALAGLGIFLVRAGSGGS